MPALEAAVEPGADAVLGPTPCVAAHEPAADAVLSSAELHRAARAGVSGPRPTLPFMQRIQNGFGPDHGNQAVLRHLSGNSAASLRNKPSAHNAAAGSGHAPDPDTSEFFEPDFARAPLEETHRALGAAFDDRAARVPIEVAPIARRSAEGVTQHGRVRLAPGRFEPHTHEGRVRLGHEVAHAIQQESGAGLNAMLSGASRASLEGEAERAGQAFARGQSFDVRGRAPAGTALYRDGQGVAQLAAEAELDRAIGEVEAKYQAQGEALAQLRKERLDYLKKNQEVVELQIPVDAALKAMPAWQQTHEVEIRVLEVAFGKGISREDAELVLRRMKWSSRSLDDQTISEHIATASKTIPYRTSSLRIAAEIFNEIVEDRARASRHIDELLNCGPDMALEVFKDVGRSYYNGALGFVQGIVDLPKAPQNLIHTLRGEELEHTFDLSSARAEYRTNWGRDLGTSGELGTMLALALVSGRLAPRSSGATSATSAASEASQATRLFWTWMKINATSAGATAVIQAGEAVRDIVRGYAIVNGKHVQLTADDVLQRIASIAFGVHAAKTTFAAAPKGNAPTSAGRTSSAADIAPDLIIERPTATTMRVTVPGERGVLIIDQVGWRVVVDEGTGYARVIASGPPEEAAQIASRLPGGAVPATTTPPTAQAPPVIPTKAVDPADIAKSREQLKLGEGAKPVEAGKTVTGDKPLDVTKPVEAGKPVEPAKSKPAKSVAPPATDRARLEAAVEAEVPVEVARGEQRQQRIAALEAEQKPIVKELGEIHATRRTWAQVKELLTQEIDAAQQSGKTTERGQKFMKELATPEDRLEIEAARRRIDAAAKRAGDARGAAATRLKGEAELQEAALRKQRDKVDAILARLNKESEGPTARATKIARELATLDRLRGLPKGGAGGAHERVSKQSQQFVYESNHIPPQDSYDKGLTSLTENKGPAILMLAEDHASLKSTGNNDPAYRASLRELVEQGKFKEAFQKDAAEIREQFKEDGRYELSLRQAELYFEELEENHAKDLKPLKPPPASPRPPSPSPNPSPIAPPPNPNELAPRL
jgi:hypothetical protein